MKLNKLYLLPALLLMSLVLISCDENEQFRGELYKKVIYLLSNSDYTFENEHALGQTTTGYVTVYCSGTEHIDKDVTVVLEHDPDALYKYNYMYYDIDESRYAHELDPAKYTIPSYQTVLRADAEDNYQNAVLGCNPKNDRMISICLQGESFNITVIQVYAPISNAE